MDWYYQEEGVQVGPLTDEEFDSRVKIGRINSATMVWNETLTSWQPYANVKERSMDRSPSGFLQTSCSQCFRQFPVSDMIRFQNSWICSSCKPIFFQRLKEGGSVAGIYDYGQFWTRFAAKIIDRMILVLIYGIFLGLGLLLKVTFPTDPDLASTLIVAAYFILIAVGAGFEAYFLPRYGATPGKMVLGLKVINADDGGPISTPRAVGRFFAEMLSRTICYVGYLLCLFDDERRTLHDRICNTLVVRK